MSKTITIDRTMLNLKAAYISDCDSEEYRILARIIRKTVEEEVENNCPIMDVKVDVGDAKKLFPQWYSQQYSHRKKVSV